jgi:hypothetical protein
MIERMKALHVSEEMANSFYDGDQRFSIRAITLRGQALEECLIEDQCRIISKLQSLSERQEELAKSSKKQVEKLESLSDSSQKQDWALIGLTVVIAILTGVLVAVALHWL